MKAGLLDTQVTIESRVVTQDDLGGPVESWSTFAVVWAEILDQRGREYAGARLLQTQASRQTIIRTRYLSGVKPTMRVSFRGRTMQISSVSEVGRRTGLELVAEDVNA